MDEQPPPTLRTLLAVASGLAAAAAWAVLWRRMAVPGTAADLVMLSAVVGMAAGLTAFYLPPKVEEWRAEGWRRFRPGALARAALESLEPVDVDRMDTVRVGGMAILARLTVFAALALASSFPLMALAVERSSFGLGTVNVALTAIFTFIAAGDVLTLSRRSRRGGRRPG